MKKRILFSIILSASSLVGQTKVELTEQVKGALAPVNGGTGLSACSEGETLVWQSGAFVCSTVSGGGADNTRLIASDFDFSQAPGGNLNASSPATVTLTPCPSGVDGSNTNHFLRILDSVAGDENVLMTGGSCTSAASSGTVQFTPSLSHSPANWTLNSASDGVQEAVWEAGKGKFVYLDGDSNVWATISIPRTSVSIVGKGPGNSGSRIIPKVDSLTIFAFDPSVGFTRFRAEGFEVNGTLLGSNTVTVFQGTNVLDTYFNHLLFENTFEAFHLDGDGITIRDTTIRGTVTAFFGDETGSDRTFNLLIDGWQQTVAGLPYTTSVPAITFQRVVAGAIRNAFFRDLNDTATYAIVLTNACEGVQVTDSIIVNSLGGILLEETTVGSGTKAADWTFIDNVMCDQIGTICVDIEGNAKFTTINQLYDTNPDAGTRAGVLLRSSTLTTGTSITQSVFQNMVTGYTGIEVESGVSWFALSGNFFWGNVGSAISVASGSSDRYVITHNFLDWAASFISDSGSGSSKHVAGNVP